MTEKKSKYPIAPKSVIRLHLRKNGRELRPRISQRELELILEAFLKAGYRTEIGTDRFRIYRRFELLRDEYGYHTRDRVY